MTLLHLLDITNSPKQLIDTTHIKHKCSNAIIVSLGKTLLQRIYIQNDEYFAVSIYRCDNRLQESRFLIITIRYVTFLYCCAKRSDICTQRVWMYSIMNKKMGYKSIFFSQPFFSNPPGSLSLVSVSLQLFVTPFFFCNWNRILENKE